MDLNPENPFGDLMSKAVKLKGYQQAQLRTRFDSWPQYFQHSMFMQESVTSVREKPFEEKMTHAEAMKAKGNEHFGNGILDEAVAEYEKALAIFKYAENTDPGWKKKGIEDKDIRVVDFVPEHKEQQDRLVAFKISCYLNIAEFERALVDLQKAYSIDPDNREVKKMYREMRELRTKQKRLDRATFSGMFNRGEVYVDDALPSSGSKENPGDDNARDLKFEKEVDEAESLARMCEARGHPEHAKEIRAKIEQAKAMGWSLTRDRNFQTFE
ncbi:hypothetical protein P43SY_008850 [Pythium insidiosum]|uniref:Uncharacterized protein n=1 Tax=Pythium insidiosum TaxID=114742 RepID=A0AAD5M6X1_PYTIN|nr:hypothetical protein P43SY_008850 [Pythium insidiosum]